MADRPRVFVSSTFYDLKQLRASLRETIEGFGFEPLLSELPPFPIDPDLETVEACRKVVADHADLFVLIVGARYGSVTDQGRSVTNLEYLEARAKRIPTYVFVDKAVLTMLQVWKQNPNGDYSGIVDSTKLFEFVDSLYSTGETWVFPFETAADIKTVLLFQWPRLIQESLALRRRFQSARLSAGLERLKGNALRLVIDKPPRWQASLIAALLDEELSASEDLRRDLQYGIAEGPIPVTIGKQPAYEWVQTQFQIGSRFGQEMTTVINELLGKALGPGAQPSVEDLAYATRRFGVLYRQALGYGIDCARRMLPEGFEGIAAIARRMWAGLIEDIHTGAQELVTLLEKAGRGETDKVEFTLTLKSPDFSGLPQEMKRLKDLLLQG